jgi:hypothetical protein
VLPPFLVIMLPCPPGRFAVIVRNGGNATNLSTNLSLWHHFWRSCTGGDRLWAADGPGDSCRGGLQLGGAGGPTGSRLTGSVAEIAA